MGRHERTTRKPTMVKAVHHAMQSSSELLALCAKYWNELANGYYLEHEEVHWDADKDAWVESDNKGNTYSTVDDFLCRSVILAFMLLRGWTLQT